MHEAAAEAIERARRGDGPTLIEAQTYRFRGHSLADPDELRPKEEKEAWQVFASFHPFYTYGVCKQCSMKSHVQKGTRGLAGGKPVTFCVHVCLLPASMPSSALIDAEGRSVCVSIKSLGGRKTAHPSAAAPQHCSTLQRPAQLIWFRGHCLEHADRLWLELLAQGS